MSESEKIDGLILNGIENNNNDENKIVTEQDKILIELNEQYPDAKLRQPLNTEQIKDFLNAKQVRRSNLDLCIKLYKLDPVNSWPEMEPHIVSQFLDQMNFELLLTQIEQDPALEKKFLEACQDKFKKQAIFELNTIINEQNKDNSFLAYAHLIQARNPQGPQNYSNIIQFNPKALEPIFQNLGAEQAENFKKEINKLKEAEHNNPKPNLHSLFYPVTVGKTQEAVQSTIQESHNTQETALPTIPEIHNTNNINIEELSSQATSNNKNHNINFTITIQTSNNPLLNLFKKTKEETKQVAINTQIQQIQTALMMNKNDYQEAKAQFQALCKTVCKKRNPFAKVFNKLGSTPQSEKQLIEYLARDENQKLRQILNLPHQKEQIKTAVERLANSDSVELRPNQATGRATLK